MRWYAMGEPGRAFGARDLVDFDRDDSDAGEALWIVLCARSADAYSAADVRELIRGSTVTLGDLRAELCRRLGGRALARALVLLEL